MTDQAPGQAAAAISMLESAFAERDSFREESTAPRIGVFGNGFPETFVTAAGGLPVHLSMGHAGARTSIDRIVEPFVDQEVRTFLNRLMNGDFAGFGGIIFSRDDAAALIAYQYATEWVRQGRAHPDVPPFFLWNLVHTDTSAVRRFNAIQAEKLSDFLTSIGLARISDGSIQLAAGQESARSAALTRLDKATGDALTGATAMRWRNAGRFMSATTHADLLETGLSGVPGKNASKSFRLGLVGSPLACPKTYEMIEGLGAIVCDLQPWGSVWPCKGNAQSSVDAILESTAADPHCPRITPSHRHRQAMVEAMAQKHCDLVICQLAQTDDTFGWEIPGLVSDLAARNIGFVNLGFRDAEPDQAWRNNAARLITAALEGRS